MSTRSFSRLAAAGLVAGALLTAAPAGAATKTPDRASTQAGDAITEHQPYGVGTGRKVG